MKPLATIGSVALCFRCPMIRTSKDYDLVAPYETLAEMHKNPSFVKVYPFKGGDKYFAQTKDGLIFESEVAWEGSLSEELYNIILNDKESLWRSDVDVVASLDVLYMLKMSHRYLKNSPHFRKTMDDIHLMRSHGAKIRPEHESFFKRRETATYNYGHPSLKRSKEEFFSGDGITYIWQHDTIHEAVKMLDKPAYQYFSGGEVWSDMDKFEALPMNIKMYAAMEECMVLAAERSQLAFPDMVIDPNWSFEKALTKVCQTITSGRFREFCWWNFHEILALYQREGCNYMDRVREGIATGVVKKT